MKFSYPGVSTHGSTPAPYRQAPMSPAKVRFLSEAPWEVAHGAKFHFLNNYLLAIVKKHKVWEKEGIFNTKCQEHVCKARQGTVLHLIVYDPCSPFTLQKWQLQISTACSAAQWPPLTHTNSCGHTEDQGVHFRWGDQSKVCLGTGAARLPCLDQH